MKYTQYRFVSPVYRHVMKLPQFQFLFALDDHGSTAEIETELHETVVDGQRQKVATFVAFVARVHNDAVLVQRPEVDVDAHISVGQWHSTQFDVGCAGKLRHDDGSICNFRDFTIINLMFASLPKTNF